MLELLIAILILDVLVWWLTCWRTASRYKPVVVWPYLLLEWLAHKPKPFM